MINLLIQSYFLVDKISSFKTDNGPILSGKTEGGVALIALSNDLIILDQPGKYNTLKTDLLLCIAVKYKHIKMIGLLCCVYISPGCSIFEYFKFFEFYFSFIH